MLLNTATLLLSTLIVFSSGKTESVEVLEAETCGLANHPPNTPSNPIYVPAIAENIQSGMEIWYAVISGAHYGITQYVTAHSPYMGAGYRTTTYFFLVTRETTKNFVKEQGTRQLIKQIGINCFPTGVANYTFVVPFQ